MDVIYRIRWLYNLEPQTYLKSYFPRKRKEKRNIRDRILQNPARILINTLSVSKNLYKTGTPLKTYHLTGNDSQSSLTFRQKTKERLRARVVAEEPSSGA